jgi:hypothetical protein
LDGYARDVLAFHFDVFTHKQHFGTGDSGFLSEGMVLFALEKLQAVPLFIAAMVVVPILILTALWCVRNRPEALAADVPIGVVILTALLLSFFAVLKHFQPHYVVVSVSLLPAALLFAASRVGPWLGRLALPIVLVAAGTTFATFIQQQLNAFEVQKRIDNDIGVIKAMPLKLGETRLWEYRIPAREYALGFVAAMTNNASVISWYDHSQLTDRATSAPGAGVWRYAVFPHQAQAQASPLRENGDVVKSLSALSVIQRIQD